MPKCCKSCFWNKKTFCLTFLDFLEEEKTLFLFLGVLVVCRIRLRFIIMLLTRTMCLCRKGEEELNLSGKPFTGLDYPQLTSITRLGEVQYTASVSAHTISYLFLTKSSNVFISTNSKVQLRFWYIPFSRIYVMQGHKIQVPFFLCFCFLLDPDLHPPCGFWS